MSGLSVNLANVETRADAFPNGVYSARITKADLEVSQNTGNPMIVLQLEIYHPTIGTATVRDWLVPSFASKIKAFYQAINNFGAQELADSLARDPEPELDPDEMVGGELLVQIGDSKPNDKGMVYKNVVAPFYFPSSRMDLLAWQEDAPL